MCFSLCRSASRVLWAVPSLWRAASRIPSRSNKNAWNRCSRGVPRRWQRFCRSDECKHEQTPETVASRFFCLAIGTSVGSCGWKDIFITFCSQVDSERSYGTSVVMGKMSSLLIWPSTQSMRFSMYFGAGSAVGFLNLSPSAQKYSYREPPLIFGHVVSVQYSDTVP